MNISYQSRSEVSLETVEAPRFPHPFPDMPVNASGFPDLDRCLSRRVSVGRLDFRSCYGVDRGVVEGMESLHWNNDMLGCTARLDVQSIPLNPAKRHDLFVIFDQNGECCGLECSQAVLRVLQHLPSGCSLL